MSNVLVILGSLNQAELSASTQVATAFLEAYTAKNPEATVETIDATEVHDVALTKNIISGNIGEYEQDVLSQRMALLEKFKAADLVVIATPMFNFGLPGQVKEVLDTFAVAGETFKYLDAPDADGNVSVGLSEGKKLVLIEAMGGFNAGVKDVAFAQVELLFNFLGVDDISYIPVQGTAVPGMEETAQRIAEAKDLAATL
ncbi:MAG: NAD(P)H-dependent oxidoreductase [Defluviitaleaceae bacterium]|nr:NAD(P)H-dependent oxidoreductase [Defluviitaleaceae bacterium]